MKAKFRQAVNIDGQHFGLTHDNKPMVHEVPEKIAAHDHFHQFVESGAIVDVDEAGHEAPQESLLERTKRMGKGLLEKASQVVPGHAHTHDIHHRADHGDGKTSPPKDGEMVSKADQEESQDLQEQDKQDSPAQQAEKSALRKSDKSKR